jgi:hypothetical protein
VLGELVQTTAGKWITHPPSQCPNGHNLGPGEVLVGHQACLGHGGGHTTWTCRRCDETLYGPPLNTHCTTLAGPATVAHLHPAKLNGPLICATATRSMPSGYWPWCSGAFVFSR